MLTAVLLAEYPALPIGQVLFSALPYLYFVRHGRVLSLYPLKPEDNQKGCFRTLACVLLSCASHPVEVTASGGHLSFSDSYVYSVFKVPVIHYFWRYDRGFSLVGFPIPWNCVAHPIFLDCVSRNSQVLKPDAHWLLLQVACVHLFVDIHRCDHLSIASRIVVYIYYTEAIRWLKYSLSFCWKVAQVYISIHIMRDI